MRMLCRLAAAIWFGGGLFLITVAAPAAFRISPTRTDAANLVGSMLTTWHYVALIVPLLLLSVEWKFGSLERTARVMLLSGALLLAAAQAMVDLRVRQMRDSSPVSISELRRSHPLRKRFGRLHGLSSLLMLLQVLAAAAVVASGQGFSTGSRRERVRDPLE